MRKLLLPAVVLANLLVLQSVEAHESEAVTVTSTGPRADAHAPIGVMGDHLHKAGEFMLSWRFMRMDMEGNRDGREGLTPEEIVAGSSLRVVPTSMGTDMHMLGAMYAPTDRVTLMLMANYLRRSMDHVTFNMMGTARLGTFTTQAEGWGDSSVTALVKLFDTDGSRAHLNIGLSLPTGSITEEGTALTPMNTRVRLRLPYAMQLGSGTWDLNLGATYVSRQGRLSWGGQYLATLRTSDNDEGYRLGDRHQVSAWGSMAWRPWISGSLRLTASTEDQIRGNDRRIAAPVQTADPDNYGGERAHLALGLNLVAPGGAVRGHRLALEYAIPVYQDLNGPQMESERMLTAGWQYAF